MEGQLASLLVQTPYVLLLAFPGINVVSAAEFAGEMGPITHYAHANAITGRQILDHPALGKRGYILDKLIDFHQGHRIPPPVMMTDLQAAADQLPSNQYTIESFPLVQRLAETRATRGRGPQPIGTILPLLLAKLGVSGIQSQTIGVRDLS